MKKVLAILCALAMTASCVSGMAFAADAKENVFLGADIEASGNVQNYMNAFDSDYKSEAKIDRLDTNDDVNEENPVEFKISFEGKTVNQIYIYDHHGAGDDNLGISHVKLTDSEGKPIVFEAAATYDANAYDFRRQNRINFAPVTDEITITITDDGEGDNNKNPEYYIMEIEGYYNEATDSEVEFELLRNTTDKNLVDVAIITSISEDEAAEYVKLKYDIVVYSFGIFDKNETEKKEGFTKKVLTTVDTNVYDSILIGETEYVASAIKATDTYVGSVVIKNINVQNPKDSNSAYVFVRVYGIDAEEHETPLTGLYRLDIPYVA